MAIFTAKRAVSYEKCRLIQQACGQKVRELEARMTKADCSLTERDNLKDRACLLNNLIRYWSEKAAHTYGDG